ncbi:GTP pyrophosphokinase [subsurface metagenome]
MSKVRALIDNFSAILNVFPEEERYKIMSAARYAAALHHKQKRASGEPYIIHPVCVAEILVESRMDYQSVIAGLLHDILEDTEISKDELRREFGSEVEALVRGVTKISLIRGMSKSVQQAESIRKMLLAMVRDIRVIMIKLADKVHNMRTLEYLDEVRRKRIASECLDIYAPLAARLGMSRIKEELEDLSLKYLKPGTYIQIKDFIARRTEDRLKTGSGLDEDLIKEAGKAKIEIKIETRAKHVFSVYRKMKKRGKSLDEIYDLFGMRILCKSPGACYEILGLVHKLRKPIEGRFKDYIAMPKSNRYQSLHTTVMGDAGNIIEIQIRTYKMHQLTEYGIASHWLYKQGYAGELPNAEELGIMNMVRSWDRQKGATTEFLEEIKREVLKDSLYVFTPKGDIFELPKGSTPIDFAYRIHTEVGNHCLAAKADGVIIPLRQELKNTQVVEIVTSIKARPHLNWLRFVRTSRAGSKIRHWLNQHDPSIFIDRNIVAKKKAEHRLPVPKKKKEAAEKQVRDDSKVGIRIGDERNMMIRIARCCQPSTGDSIIGYISRGRGIIVHKEDCHNLKGIKEFAERSIEVEWETVSPKATRRFQLTAHLSSNLFSEIEGAIRKFNGHLIEGKLEGNDPETLEGFFMVEIDNREDFGRVIKNIRTIPSIIRIEAL